MLCRLLIALLSLTCCASAQEAKTSGRPVEGWPPSRTIDLLRHVSDCGYSPQVVISWDGPQGAGTLGFGTIADDLQVDEKSVFEIGSITKVFTAFLLADAIESKLVTPETTVGDLLGDALELPKSTAAITLAELASHRSGLPRLPGNLVFDDESRPYEHYDEKLLLEELQTGKLSSAPGSYSYSNYGAGLLGYLMARLAKTSYPELLAEKITKPLGMKSTAPEPLPALAARTVPGHNGQVPVPHWKMNALAGAGDLVSSAEDMQRFLKAALTADDTTSMGRAFLMMEKVLGPTDGMMKVGMGWHLVEKEGLNLIWHNGGTGGFSSFAGYDKVSGRSLVIIASSDAPNITGAGLNAFDDMIPSGLDGMPKPAKDHWKNLHEFEGRYRLATSLVLEVRLKGDYLGVQMPGEAWYTVYPSGKDDGFFLSIAGAQGNFLRNDEKVVVGLEWSMQGETMQAPKMEELPVFVNLKQAELKRLEGRYELAEDLYLDVKAEKGRLSVKLADQPRLDVYPISATDFVYKIVDAKLSFVIDEAGKVTAVRLHQNGGIQEAPRRD